MKSVIFLLMLILGNQLIAQQSQFNPTKADIDSIYNRVVRAQKEAFFKTNPVLEDISEQARDSVFLILINKYRLSKGLGSLTYINTLDSACKLHTKWLLKVERVAHIETIVNFDGNLYPNVKDRVCKFDEKWMLNHPLVLENCGGSGSSLGSDSLIQYKHIKVENVYEIFNGWKASPGHNAAMLNENVKYIGFYLGSKYNPTQNSYKVMGTLLLSN